MKFLVGSVTLRVIYIVFGGIPAIFLAGFCAMFLTSTFAFVLGFGVKDLMAVFSLVLLMASVVGTISGWLAFFGIAIKSRVGRVIHTICIGSGMIAAVVLGWDSIHHFPRDAAGSMVLSITVVGSCLLWHLWSAAQQVVPPDAANGAARVN